MSDIDYGSILEVLNEKADLDLGNVTASVSSAFLKSDLTNIPQGMDFVIDSYYNGTDWYRLYKSGWCEQGGINSNNSKNERTQDLLKPYIDSNYFVNVSYNGDGSIENGAIDAYNKAPNSFKMKSWSPDSICWVAKGYTYIEES